ncbi:hypothetical protein LCGC14_0346000 [marine sediment metagenome]|uniref:Uncharacterized protein n=1 Tax=marine sediment metagenome TaxID=412755 RepID=A0A0F9WK40_9ZZZZ
MEKTKELTFEIGRYYKHTTGHKLHIITACRTTLYGWTHIAEQTGVNGYENFLAVGFDESSATNYTEIDETEWMESFS